VRLFFLTEKAKIASGKPVPYQNLQNFLNNNNFTTNISINMIQPSKYNQSFTLFAVLILTNNNLREYCYQAKRHYWGGESSGLAKQGGRTSSERGARSVDPLGLKARVEWARASGHSATGALENN
jgi:hypothetical protein